MKILRWVVRGLKKLVRGWVPYQDHTLSGTAKAEAYRSILRKVEVRNRLERRK